MIRQSYSRSHLCHKEGKVAVMNSYLAIHEDESQGLGDQKRIERCMGDGRGAERGDYQGIMVPS
jgi:hypothetical protein